PTQFGTVGTIYPNLPIRDVHVAVWSASNALTTPVRERNEIGDRTALAQGSAVRRDFGRVGYEHLVTRFCRQEAIRLPGMRPTPTQVVRRSLLKGPICRQNQAAVWRDIFPRVFN